MRETRKPSPEETARRSRLRRQAEAADRADHTARDQLEQREGRRHHDEAGRGDRGRSAKTPTEVPKKGWIDILKRTKEQIGADNLSIVAAGVAFFCFVAIIPAMAALVAIYALVSDPGQITAHLNALQRVVPGEAMPLLQDQLTRLAADNTAAGWGLALGIIVALASSMKGTKALMTGLNIAYDERERRGFFKLHLVAFVLTVAAIVGVACLVALIAVLPGLLSAMNIGSVAETALNWLRWPVLALLFTFGLAVLYRWAPSRDAPQWKWLSPGAGGAALLWLIGSALFSVYVTRFGDFDQTYGSLGAVVVFLLWLYLTAFVVLLGAELNSEMERQTAQDTTKGEPNPIGSRDAYAADTVGGSTR
jgi:membrane protein